MNEDSKPLTAAEVIEELRQAPQDAYVLGVQGDCGWGLVSGLARGNDGSIEVEQAFFSQDAPWMGGNVEVKYERMGHHLRKKMKGKTLYPCVTLETEAWDPEGLPDDDDTPLDG